MTPPLRIGFMGTPDFAKIALETLLTIQHDIVCVYTQPPRPKGRGKKLSPSPVHLCAQHHNIPVFHPQTFKNQTDIDHFHAHKLDLAIVAAYGLILPKAILDAPRLGCINIHASLLPRWRGAAPIQRAIWAGDTQTGICLMEMEQTLDTGPVYSRQTCPITAQTTAQSLHNTLANTGAHMTRDLLKTITETGKLPPSTPQDDSQATYAHMLKKEHGRINWSDPADAIDRHIRALTPWPGTWTQLNHKDTLFKIQSAQTSKETTDKPPGTLLDKHGHIACGDATRLQITHIQPPGKKPMDITSAINGGYLSPGDQFS